jgi:predicted PurR-regulated permease PerM
VDETPRRELVLPREFYIVLGVVATGYVLYWLRSVLTPLFLAFSIAYVLDPVIDRFEAVKIPRPAGIAIVLVVLLGTISAFVALVLPVVVSDLATVASMLPSKISELIASADPWLTAHGIHVPHTTTEWMERLGANANDFASSLVAPAGGILGALVARSFSMVGSVVAALVVPVLSIYLLNDFDRITAAVRGHLPRRYRRVVLEYAREIDLALSHFVRGQLTVMAIMAVLYGTAYSILGVRLALPIGLISGTLSFIPYLGSAFALISGLLMSLLGGFHPGQLAGVVIAYAIVQALEGFVIAPRVMGKTVGIADMWILIALFVGGEIFGFLGVLLAVPTAAVIKIFLARAVDIYHESDLFLEGPASLRSIIPPEPVRTSSIPPAATPPIPPGATVISSSSSSVPPPPPSLRVPSLSNIPAAPSSSPSASATPAPGFKTPVSGHVKPRSSDEE